MHLQEAGCDSSLWRKKSVIAVAKSLSVDPRGLAGTRVLVLQNYFISSYKTKACDTLWSKRVMATEHEPVA